MYQNRVIDKSWYRIDAGKGTILLSQNLKQLGDSANIVYRIFPYKINEPIYQRNLSQLNLAGNNRPRAFTIYSDKKNNGAFSNSQLEKQGNYTRGLSYGTNQDVVMNSNLNLQLSGKLTEEVSILAAISDNNIPIQPDGNTQSIQDFDRIYIQLYDETKELTLGDYEIESPTGNFMRFNKKVQGGKFSGLVAKGKNNGQEFTSTISASITKGKFNRMELRGSEGIQGPYRLSGANNESYIVVLAGSEKVFIDGNRLTRGEKNDYVINYNTAELSFTTQQPITRNSRIIIEFEYSEENYSRYLIFNSNVFRTQKGKFWFNFYHEQDSKSQSIDQALSDNNKLLLSEIGDNLQLARVSNVEKVDYSNDFVLYRKINRTIAEQNFEIYQYSTNADSAIYRVNFLFVGANNGNYRQVNNTTNGRVYQWIDPENGVPQGGYEPIIQLITPQKQEMISIGADVQLNKNLLSKMELAFTNHDLNTFSSRDDKDNQGLAINFSLLKQTHFTDSLHQLVTELNVHHIQKNFSEIEPFRNTEFERDWNLQNEFSLSNEDFYSISNQFSNANWGHAGYKFSILKRGSNYSGNLHSVDLQFSKNKLSLEFSGNSLSTNQEEDKTKFYRHSSNTSYSLSFLKIGMKTENENNQWEKKAEGTLKENSFSFRSYKFYIANLDSIHNQLQAYYKNRKDFLPSGDQLTVQSESHDFGTMIWLKKNPTNQLKLESVFRKLSILNKSITDEKPENTFLGKLEHQARIKKGLLQTSTYYELGSGLESEKEFSYVEVNSGQGVYRWTDYNQNEIKEINEFEIANFKDQANYIRLATNTRNYQKVYTSEFRQSFFINLKRLKTNNKFSSVLSRFSNRFAYRLNKKSVSNDFNLYANPFQPHASNENLITINSSFQNTFSYQKPKSKTNWDLIHLSANGKQLQMQGFEQRNFSQNGFRFLWRPGVSYQFSNRTDIGKKSLTNESFHDKDYQLTTEKNELNLKFQPTLSFQFGLNYIYHHKENNLATEKSITHNMGAEFQYSPTKKGQLMGSVNFLNVDYNSNSNTSVAYEMLEGFLPGKNTTWSLAYNQQVSKLFQINLSYNGRNSETGKTIHVGSVEIRAYF